MQHQQDLLPDLPPDICESYDSLPVLSDLAARTVGYTIPEGQMPICDDYLTEQWYSMDNYVLTSNTTECGTWENWYRDGMTFNYCMQ